MKTKNGGRSTFKEIVEASRAEAAGYAWDRACLASQLRHLATRSKQFVAARKAAEVKERAIRLAVALIPDGIHVTIDSDYQVGLTSVQWKGKGRLHLPASADLITKC